jgi:hypothetical protein
MVGVRSVGRKRVEEWEVRGMSLVIDRETVRRDDRKGVTKSDVGMVESQGKIISLVIGSGEVRDGEGQKR